jgi:hypothetical protein
MKFSEVQLFPKQSVEVRAMDQSAQNENSFQKAHAGPRTEEEVTLVVDYKQNRIVDTFLGSSVPIVKV